MQDVITLLDELIDKPSSVEFYGINDVLLNKLKTIRLMALRSEDESNLATRDKFIVEKGLWDEFVNQLPARKVPFSVASLWRNGVTNTVILVDRVRKAYADRKKAKAIASLKGYDDELDRVLDRWVRFTRAATPSTYEEAEQAWKQFIETLDDEGASEPQWSAP